MKYIITKNQYYNFFSKLFESKNIEISIMYLNDNRRNSITATVYLYKDGKILGYRHGYEFFYNYDSRFDVGQLQYESHHPNIESVDLFKYIPSKIVIDFFSNKVKDYLVDFIKKGYSGLPLRK